MTELRRQSLAALAAGAPLPSIPATRARARLCGGHRTVWRHFHHPGGDVPIEAIAIEAIQTGTLAEARELIDLARTGKLVPAPDRRASMVLRLCDG
jgi:hypothetical protein